MTSKITHIDGARADNAGTDAPRTEAFDATTFRTETTAGTGAAAPSNIHLEKHEDERFDYAPLAIAAGALGLGVLAYKGVSALLARRSDARSEAVPMTQTGHLSAVPLEPEPQPAATVGATAGAEFIGEPVSLEDSTPFVAASDDDDTGDLIVEVTEIDIVAVSTAGGGSGPEHVPTDLMGDRVPGAGDRAIDAFRPDPTAPVPDAMRESLRPATGPATGFAGNRGDFASGLSQADGSKS